MASPGHNERAKSKLFNFVTQDNWNQINTPGLKHIKQERAKMCCIYTKSKIRRKPPHMFGQAELQIISNHQWLHTKI